MCPVENYVYIDEGKNLERLDEGQKRMEKYEKTVKDNLYSNLLNQNNNQIKDTNMGMTNYQFRLQSLDVVRNFEQRLQQTNENLKKELYDLKIYFEALSEGDMWNDKYHTEYGEEYLSEIEKSINQVVNLIENESMKYLQTYKHKAEEVGFQ